MKTPHSTVYRYTAETIAEANKLPIGTVSESDHKRGMEYGEPIIVMMDALLKYAEAHQIRFESPLSEDGFLGDVWLDAAKSVRALCNGNGEVANRKGFGTDSKDNGCVESVFWAAMRHAGFTEEDL